MNLFDAKMSSLQILSAQRKSENIVILFHESCEEFTTEQADERFLSEAGIQVKGNLFLKKKSIIHGFHKAIITNSSVIFIVDDSVLSKNETPADKVDSMIKIMEKNLSITIRKKFTYFFPAIKKLYHDKTVGEIHKGYFTTSSGTQYFKQTRTQPKR